MKPSPQKIIEDAMRLEPTTRAFVAESLLESLDFEEDFPISEEWGQEIRRRCEEIDSGKAVLVDGDTVLSNLRKKYPGVPIVTYVNTSVEVKAESDICCTSGNAVKIVESLGVDRVLLIPDRFLAANVAAETNVEILTWQGECEVHERFTARQVKQLRKAHPNVTVLAHPECPPEVVEAADYSGSTAGMINFVSEQKPAEVALITECSMGDNIASENPDTNFIRSCNLCPHMKRITLPKILDSLLEMKEEVLVDPMMAEKARRAVERRQRDGPAIWPFAPRLVTAGG